MEDLNLLVTVIEIRSPPLEIIFVEEHSLEASHWNAYGGLIVKIKL